MTEEKDDDVVEPVVLLDLGDAIIETKQQSPDGSYPDCYYWIGSKWGCG